MVKIPLRIDFQSYTKDVPSPIVSRGPIRIDLKMRLLLGAHICSIDIASGDDSSQLSFTKGDILDILNDFGEWWHAKRPDGISGSTSIGIYCVHALIFFARCSVLLL